MHSGLFICGSAQLSSNAGELVADAQELRSLEPACNSRHARLRQAHRACSAISEEHCASNSAHVLAPARSCQGKRAPLYDKAGAGGPCRGRVARVRTMPLGLRAVGMAVKLGPTKDTQVTHAELMIKAQHHSHSARRSRDCGGAGSSACTRSSAERTLHTHGSRHACRCGPIGRSRRPAMRRRFAQRTGPSNRQLCATGAPATRRRRSVRASTCSAIEPFEVKLDTGERAVAAARSWASGSLRCR